MLLASDDEVTVSSRARHRDGASACNCAIAATRAEDLPAAVHMDRCGFPGQPAGPPW